MQGRDKRTAVVCRLPAQLQIQWGTFSPKKRWRVIEQAPDVVFWPWHAQKAMHVHLHRQLSTHHTLPHVHVLFKAQPIPVSVFPLGCSPLRAPVKSLWVFLLHRPWTPVLPSKPWCFQKFHSGSELLSSWAHRVSSALSWADASGASDLLTVTFTVSTPLAT